MYIPAAFAVLQNGCNVLLSAKLAFVCFGNVEPVLCHCLGKLAFGCHQMGRRWLRWLLWNPRWLWCCQTHCKCFSHFGFEHLIFLGKCFSFALPLCGFALPLFSFCKCIACNEGCTCVVLEFAMWAFWIHCRRIDVQSADARAVQPESGKPLSIRETNQIESGQPLVNYLRACVCVPTCSTHRSHLRYTIKVSASKFNAKSPSRRCANTSRTNKHMQATHPADSASIHSHCAQIPCALDELRSNLKSPANAFFAHPLLSGFACL